jgi:hypothetical protein
MAGTTTTTTTTTPTTHGPPHAGWFRLRHRAVPWRRSLSKHTVAGDGETEADRESLDGGAAVVFTDATAAPTTVSPTPRDTPESSYECHPNRVDPSEEEAATVLQGSLWSVDELVDTVMEPHRGRGPRTRGLRGGLVAVGADGRLGPGVPHPAGIDIKKLLDECKVVQTRRGGPGGQHRNKVNTAAVLTHEPSRITAEASERRSQVQNHKVAVMRLRLALALKLRCAPSPTGEEWGPGAVLIQRCTRKGVLAVSHEHADFPTVLADLLDGMELSQYSLGNLAASIDRATPKSHRPIRRTDIVILLNKVLAHSYWAH